MWGVPDTLGFIAFLALLASHVEGFSYHENLRRSHPPQSHGSTLMPTIIPYFRGGGCNIGDSASICENHWFFRKVFIIASEKWWWKNHEQILITLGFQIPPEKVFQVCFWGPNTSSQGVWTPRVMKMNDNNSSTLSEAWGIHAQRLLYRQVSNPSAQVRWKNCNQSFTNLENSEITIFLRKFSNNS